MPTDLIFQEVKSSKASGPYVLIRRPQNRTRDSLYTIGKIRGVMKRRKSLSEPRQVEGWRLELNGQDSLTMQEVADVYLTMVAMSEGTQP